MTTRTPTEGERQDPELRASQVFEAWLIREAQGAGEPFDELLQRHPDLQKSLERMRRLNAIVQDALHSSTPADSRSQEERNRTLGDYRIVREIARGAMGIVFEAEQISLRRRVALKVLPAQLTLNSRALTRFKREAEISAKLNHRNIIDIHQIGEVAGVHFIVMELVEGTSLDRVIERMRRESFESGRKHRISEVVSVQGLEGPPLFAPAEPTRVERKKGSSSTANRNYIETAVRLICHVADALDHAHKAGVIHRDVKPSNILVRPDGSPVLTDFGLAREEGLPAVSMTGDFAGTPHYVSPEQAMAGRMPVDHRADVFSLGATLYELLTLELPFPGETIHEVLQKIVTKQPRDPAKLNPALAPDLVTIVLKTLEKDPDRRYPTAAALADDLRAFIQYRPIHARRTPTVVRAFRWLKREPLKAAMVALLAVGVPLVAFLGRDAWTLAARRGDLVEADLGRAFLELGLGRHRAAEAAFQECLASDPGNVESFAGLVLVLIEQERAEEALAALDEHESRFGASLVSRRLRVDALRLAERSEEARTLEAEIGSPTSAVEEYVEALRLLRGTSFVREVGQDLTAEPALDTVVEQRQRARKAVHWLERAVVGKPRAAYEFTLASACWLAGDEAKARLVADTLPRNWGEEALAWYYVGVARELFDEGAAIEAFELAFARDARLTEARQRCAILLLRADPERGLAMLDELARDRPDEPDGHVNLAAGYYTLGRYEEAARVARRALDLDPGRVAALDTLGSALVKLGDYAAACAPLIRAIELEPNGARLHNDLGWALWRTGMKNEGRHHLLRARELDPESSVTLANLGGIGVEEGDFRGAIGHFEEALRKNDARPQEDFSASLAWSFIGLARWRLGLQEEALEAYEEAHRLAPQDPGHAASLGLALIELGRTEEALALLEQAVAGGTQRGEVYDLLLSARASAGDFSAALRTAKRWTDALPESPNAWNMRAWLQVDPEGDPALRDPEDALLAAETAVRLTNGEDPEMLDSNAWALYWAGKPEEALSLAQEAVEVAKANSPGVVAELEGSLSRMAEMLSSAER